MMLSINIIQTLGFFMSFVIGGGSILYFIFPGLWDEQGKDRDSFAERFKMLLVGLGMAVAFAALAFVVGFF